MFLYGHFAISTKAYVQNVHIFKKWNYGFNYGSGAERLMPSLVCARAPFYNIGFKSIFIELLPLCFGFQIHLFPVFVLYVCRVKFLVCCSLSSQMEATEMEPLCPRARVCQAGSNGHQ